MISLSRKTKQSRSTGANIIGIQLGSEGVIAPGYHRLTDAPEVAAAVWRISDLISSMSIHLMENGPSGDTRVRDELARKVDVNPWSLGTRATWMRWIVMTMLLRGEAFVLPIVREGIIADLAPMPGAMPYKPASGPSYCVQWRGQIFDQGDILHFPLRPDPDQPWRGQGPEVQLQAIVDSIIQATNTKTAYMSTEYRPPLIVAVNSNADLDSEASRDALAQKYLKRSNPAEPWIIPADLLTVVQAKPLTLTDLAIKDGVELDKKAVASIIGVPGFMVGVGSYNRDEYNTFVSAVLMPICLTIQMELTRKLLISDRRYFRMNVRSLYSYSLKELAEIGDEQYIRGLMTGNEVRNWLDLEPLDGLDELVMLENYIPAGMIGDQKKLIQEGAENGNQ